VHFLVYGKTAHYIENNPLHGSQVNHRIDENTLEVKLKVKINKELERILLSYAPDIRLLAPAKLVKTHREQLDEAIKRYEKSEQ
jgi:predicted DNA-binding transcriptional regulator YafY